MHVSCSLCRSDLYSSLVGVMEFLLGMAVLWRCLVHAYRLTGYIIAYLLLRVCTIKQLHY